MRKDTKLPLGQRARRAASAGIAAGRNFGTGFGSGFNYGWKSYGPRQAISTELWSTLPRAQHVGFDSGYLIGRITNNGWRTLQQGGRIMVKVAKAFANAVVTAAKFSWKGMTFAAKKAAQGAVWVWRVLRTGAKKTGKAISTGFKTAGRKISNKVSATKAVFKFGKAMGGAGRKWAAMSAQRKGYRAGIKKGKELQAKANKWAIAGAAGAGAIAGSAITRMREGRDSQEDRVNE